MRNVLLFVLRLINLIGFLSENVFLQFLIIPEDESKFDGPEYKGLEVDGIIDKCPGCTEKVLRKEQGVEPARAALEERAGILPAVEVRTRPVESWR